LCCYRPGQRSRLIYRTLLYRGRKGEPKGFREPDLIRLLDAAHQQLQAPIVLVWERLSLHKTPAIRAAIVARPSGPSSSSSLSTISHIEQGTPFTSTY
jgi:putative transposase